MTDCLFCKMVLGDVPCHRVWEDEGHLAFLTIFPNTPGFTVVITKEHLPSYAFANTDAQLSSLVLAAKTVAKKIDLAFDDVGRTGLIFEGFGVDHLHAKLIPMHGTKTDIWKQHLSRINTFFDRYPGYLSSHDAVRADDVSLERIAKKIRG